MGAMSGRVGGKARKKLCASVTSLSRAVFNERATNESVEEHIPCHKGAYMGKNGITRDRTGKLWYYRNFVEEHIPCHKRGVYGKERDNAG